MESTTQTRIKRLYMFKNIKIKDKVWFKEELKPYTVRALSDKFIILTKPFNLHRTYFYVIVDIEKGVRGAGNVRCDYSTDDACLKRLDELHKGSLMLDMDSVIKCIVSKVN